MGDDYYRLGFDKKEAPGMLAPMLGGTPDEVPQQYALYSPITHVHKDCPPTLLLHGQQDTLVPVNPVRHLYARLKSLGVPVVMHLLPQTDHAFDLIFPNCSPSAQNAFFDVERFLAIVPFLSATPRSLTKGEERHSTSFK